jgi:hypothetical protein
METSQIEIRVKGKKTYVPSARICDRTVITRGGWLKVAVVKDEDLVEGDTVVDPESFVAQLKECRLKADLLTFAQRLSDTTPKYAYHHEWDNWAAIPITTYADWFKNRAESSVQRAVRKAAKSGVVVRLVEFDDAFVRDIVTINNESPIRQGRPYWHFQKSFEDVKREYSTYSDRNIFLGAYLQNELVGFMRITCADKVASTIMLLSKIQHYDKRPSNALIAKAVEVCEQQGFSYLTYWNYIYNDPKSSLTEFKRRNGFEQLLVPRYYIPLTIKGKIALSLGLHRELASHIPKALLNRLLTMRNSWYERKYKSPKESA